MAPPPALSHATIASIYATTFKWHQETAAWLLGAVNVSATRDRRGGAEMGASEPVGEQHPRAVAKLDLHHNSIVNSTSPFVTLTRAPFEKHN